MENLAIRPLRVGDGKAVAEIFFAAVHEGAAGYYTPGQRAAWAGHFPDPYRWTNRLIGLDGFVGELKGEVVGFMTIDASGYIDLAFVHPQMAGKGIGRLLYEVVEMHARRMGAVRLTTEASKAARPFFERLGWSVDQAQTVLKRNVPLENFRMSKPLPVNSDGVTAS